MSTPSIPPATIAAVVVTWLSNGDLTEDHTIAQEIYDLIAEDARSQRDVGGLTTDTALRILRWHIGKETSPDILHDAAIVASVFWETNNG